MPILPLKTEAGYLIEDLRMLVKNRLDDVARCCWDLNFSQKIELALHADMLRNIDTKLQDLERIVEGGQG